MSQPLDLTITNPFDFVLRVANIEITIADATSDPGCNGPDNYRVEPMSANYPLVLRPGSWQLSDLVGAAALPRVRMLNLAVNQDACKGARITLLLNGSGER